MAIVVIITTRGGFRRVDPNIAHGRIVPQNDIRKPPQRLDERAHERLHPVLKRKQRSSTPEPRLPLSIPLPPLLFGIGIGIIADPPPSGRTELAPNDRPVPARLARAQSREGRAQTELSRIRRVYPVYERAAQRTRERFSEPPREERVDGFVVVIAIVITCFCCVCVCVCVCVCRWRVCMVVVGGYERFCEHGSEHETTQREREQREKTIWQRL